ncbi:hypothetical protein TorRG33x02_273980, partial [Trema orientale]
FLMVQCQMWFNVFLVLKLTYNLLSISKLTKDLRCITQFSSTYCVFQDLKSGKTISNGKDCAGLYLLKVTSNPKKQAHHTSVSLSVFSNLSNKKVQFCWGILDPNFQYLRKLLPTLFKNVNSKLLQCEICQFLKHVRSNYPIQGYKSSHPFTMIHSDIWGLSRVKMFLILGGFCPLLMIILGSCGVFQGTWDNTSKFLY